MNRRAQGQDEDGMTQQRRVHRRWLQDRETEQSTTAIMPEIMMTCYRLAPYMDWSPNVSLNALSSSGLIDILTSRTHRLEGSVVGGFDPQF
jgi:hypothetical protein